MRIALVAPLAQPYLGGAKSLLADLARGVRKHGLYATLCVKDGSVVPSVRIEPVTVSENIHPADFAGPVQ